MNIATSQRRSLKPESHNPSVKEGAYFFLKITAKVPRTLTAHFRTTSQLYSLTESLPWFNSSKVLSLMLPACHPQVCWIRGALVLLAAARFCNKPRFLSGTQHRQGGGGGKRAEQRGN